MNNKLLSCTRNAMYSIWSKKNSLMIFSIIWLVWEVRFGHRREENWTLSCFAQTELPCIWLSSLYFSGPSESIFMAIPMYFFCHPLVFRLFMAMYFSRKIGISICFLSLMFMIWCQLIFYDLTFNVSPSCSKKIDFPRPCKTSSTVEFPRFDSNEVLCFNIARKWNICSSERSTCHIFDWGCFQKISIKELVTDPMFSDKLVFFLLYSCKV